MSRVVSFLCFGAVFHIVYLWSIFEIYFTSPVLQISKRFKPDVGTDGPPADRVVLIVGDGLRADKLFQLYSDPAFPEQQPLPAFEPHRLRHFDLAQRDGKAPLAGPGYSTPAPFLRSLILDNQASYGVSWTRVPTESRPGHVALLGGLYEDPSAVLKGWKLNPVNFDSVLNQSTHSWAFGSPDIVPMFKYGATPGKVDMFCYDAEEEDFTRDAVELDLWVLDQVDALFKNASVNPALAAKLQQQGNFFFLHLLGLDTTGHAFRPNGAEYHRNIQDNRTAFIFTADHGMSDIGNHGDGHPDNTRTPIVAFGSGIDGSTMLSSFGHDEYSTHWQLGHTDRKDMEQADVAALMTSLLGNAFPANSVGKNPAAYLDVGHRYRASSAIANALQILEQYRTLHDIKAAHTINFRAYPTLNSTDTMETRANSLRRKMDQQDFVNVVLDAAQLSQDALNGLRYLHTYNWLLLRSIVVAGYLGGMAYGATFLYQTYHMKMSLGRSQSIAPAVLGATLFVMLSARFILEKSPVTYYVYAAFPCFLWTQSFHVLSQMVKANSLGNIVQWVFVTVALLESMVVGYFRRQAWALGYLAFGLAIPYSRSIDTRTALIWMASCMACGVFPLLPVDMAENLWLLAIGASAFLITAIKQSLHLGHTSARRLHLIVASIIGLTTYISLSSAQKLQRKIAVYSSVRLLHWISLALSQLPLFFIGQVQDRLHRIMAVALILAPTYISLTISFETLFFFLYAINLILWVYIESKDDRKETKSKTEGLAKHSAADNLRRALFVLFAVHVGFFGTGNVASLSSFYLESVYRLVPVFQPFLMACLLLYKILIPFAVLAASVSALNASLRLPSFYLFLLALTISDVLTLNFFYLVRDSGSWLEIGQSISHFTIASLLLIFMAMLFLLGQKIMQGAV